MKIACYEVEDWEKPYLKKKLANHNVLFFKDYMEDKNLVKDAEIVVPFVQSKITAQLLQKMPKLKFIATRSTGYDHIDVKAANLKGIFVSNVPEYGSNTVAEHTFALLLNISKRISESYERVKQGEFSPQGLMGFDLKDKTLGIIGTGKIGLHVARIARGFGMRVIAYDPFPNMTMSSLLNFNYVDFDTLLKTSDVITVHVPYLPTTHHLINKQNVLKIKKGAVLLNTARGAIVETEAILLGLRKDILSYVGLDVLEEERFLQEELHLLTDAYKEGVDFKLALEEHTLVEHPRVIITPHNAFNTKEAILRILDTTVANIEKFIEGKPQNLVKPL